jgi:hypothetical protein
VSKAFVSTYNGLLCEAETSAEADGVLIARHFSVRAASAQTNIRCYFNGPMMLSVPVPDTRACLVELDHAYALQT